VIEQDLAVADGKRLAREHDAQPPVIALELQNQAARGVFDDLLSHAA
jgi:hypothetical protein